MNDETREQLSAYLDGALPEAERLELEARLAASAELRGALEDLRSVSRAVKDLPQEPLPAGFMARLQARRARGENPRASWVFLPPEARPVVAALSFGVVALVIWDKVAVPPEQAFLHPPETAKVFGSANAPVAQLNVSAIAQGISGAAGSLQEGSRAEVENKLSDAKALDIAGPAAPKPRVDGALVTLNDDAGRAGGGGGAGNAAPARKAEALSGKFGAVASVRGGSARAPGHSLDELKSSGYASAAAEGAPAAAPAAAPSEPQLADRARSTMSEEERSARNEQLIGQLEKQKKSLGLKVLTKEEADKDSGFLRQTPSAPVVRAPRPNLLKAAKPSGAAPGEATAAAADSDQPAGPGRLTPDAALVFSDERSLSSSWVLLGLPGDPPAVDFANQRLILIKPSGTKILMVTPGAGSISVVYRSLMPDEPTDPARDRVAPLPAEPKTVLIYDASPR